MLNTPQVGQKQRSMPRHIITCSLIKRQKKSTDDLQRSKEEKKKLITYKGCSLRIRADFSLETS